MTNFEKAFGDLFEDGKYDFEEVRNQQFIQRKIDVINKVIRNRRDQEIDSIIFDDFGDVRKCIELKKLFDTLERYEKLENTISESIKRNVTVERKEESN